VIFWSHEMTQNLEKTLCVSFAHFSVKTARVVLLTKRINILVKETVYQLNCHCFSVKSNKRTR
jgi:hypothetical protein